MIYIRVRLLHFLLLTCNRQLALCNIPAEHTIDIIWRLMSALTKYLVFAAAWQGQGQGSMGHIDVSHSREWWIEQFAAADRRLPGNWTV